MHPTPSLGGIRLDDDLPQRLAMLLNLRGVVVLRAASARPAPGGLREAAIDRDGSIVLGDVITAVDGKPIRVGGAAAGRTGRFQAGQHDRFTVLRQGCSATLRIALGSDG